MTNPQKLRPRVNVLPSAAGPARTILVVWEDPTISYTTPVLSREDLLDLRADLDARIREIDGVGEPTT